MVIIKSLGELTGGRYPSFPWKMTTRHLQEPPLIDLIKYSVNSLAL